MEEREEEGAGAGARGEGGGKQLDCVDQIKLVLQMIESDERETPAL